MLTALLKAGAKVEIVDPFGSSYVGLAALMDNVPAIGILSRHGAGIDVPDEEGRTPFMVAAYIGSMGAVRSLLDLGANCDKKDENGDGAMSLAVLAENKEVTKVIYTKCPMCFQEMKQVMEASKQEFDRLVDSSDAIGTLAKRVANM